MSISYFIRQVNECPFSFFFFSFFVFRKFSFNKIFYIPFFVYYRSRSRSPRSRRSGGSYRRRSPSRSPSPRGNFCLVGC